MVKGKGGGGGRWRENSIINIYLDRVYIVAARQSISRNSERLSSIKS